MMFQSKKSRETKSILAALDRSQAVIHFDLDGTILWANENFLQTIGYTLDEIKGRHHRLFVDPAEAAAPAYRAFWDRLRQGAFDAGEYKRFGKGGREVWIQASYNPIIDARGRPFKVVKFATDVTQDKLRNADMEGQIDAIGKSQAVIHFDLDGTIVWANENFLQATGYKLDEIAGQHHRLFVDPAEAASSTYRQFWADLKKGVFSAGEYKRLGKDGRAVWIQASYNPIFDMNGKPFKVVKFASDITAQVLRRQESQRVGDAVDNGLNDILASVEKASKTAATLGTDAVHTSGLVQAVAEASDQLAASVGEIAQSMSHATEAARQAENETHAADNETQRLLALAQGMTSIVDFIHDIADQINLLALNATIESARAGEAGRGFAVVASEVKGLAGQVGNATVRISQEINGIQNIATAVGGKLGQISNRMRDVATSVTTVSAAVEEQQAVTRDISANMQAAASAVDSIRNGLDGVSTDVDTAATQANAGAALYHQLREL